MIDFLKYWFWKKWKRKKRTPKISNKVRLGGSDRRRRWDYTLKK